MKIDNFWFIRHAKSNFQEYHKDPTINKEGLIEANKLKNQLSDKLFAFSKFYCSTKKRAIDTYKAVFPNTKCEYIKELNEIHKPFHLHNEKYDLSILAHQERLKEWMITNLNNKDVLVSHGGIFFMIIKILSAKYNFSYIPNCSLMHFKKINNLWNVIYTTPNQ